MSTRPDDPMRSDALIEHVPESEVWSQAIEDHLDAHPLHVDDADIAASVARLEARLGAAPDTRRRSRWPVVVLALAIAAAGLFALRASTGPVWLDATQPSADIEVHKAAVPEPIQEIASNDLGSEITFVEVRRTVTLAPDSKVLSSERPGSAVLLVQEGQATAGDTTIPAGHWALLTRLEDGTESEVVFPDGTAPPPLPDDVWGGTAVQPQLEKLRFQSLPDRTLDTLDQLLEDR